MADDNTGMPGWGSMPMNMGLLNLGAGLLAQSGWQDEDISPGQALGRALPGAVNSYFSGVKSLQDAQLYQAKMKDILDARERRKGLQDDLPGVIDNLKGKISGIPDARLEVIKSLVKSAPEQAAQIVSNLASQASKGKFTYRLANDAEIASGINPGTMMEVDPTNDKVEIFNKKPGEIKVNEIPGGVYLSQDGVFKQTLSTGSKASEKSLLEKIGPAYVGLKSEDPFVRAAAVDKLERGGIKQIPTFDENGNWTGNTELATIKREINPELLKNIKNLNNENSQKSERPFTTVKGDLGFNAIAKRLLPEGSSESEIAAFSDKLEEWNPNLDTKRLSDGQTVYTGPPISSNEIPSEIKTSTVIPGKLSESQAKASGYAEVMIMAEKNISDLFKSGYRPDQGTWLFMEASNLEIEKPGFLDTFFRQEVGKQLSDDDRTFVRNVMAMADASIRDKSGAAVKEGELRSEIRRLFNRETAVGTVTDQARLDSSNFRRGILQSIINKAGPSKTRLQNSFKELVKPRSVFKLNTGDQLRDDLIKKYKLTPPS